SAALATTLTVKWDPGLSETGSMTEVPFRVVSRIGLVKVLSRPTVSVYLTGKPNPGTLAALQEKWGLVTVTRESDGSSSTSPLGKVAATVTSGAPHPWLLSGLRAFDPAMRSASRISIGPKVG